MKRQHVYEIGYLARVPLKTPYPGVVAAIGSVMSRLPKGTNLLVDSTGVGRGIYDMLTHEGWSPIGITITGGDWPHREEGGRRYSVPKATIISKLISLTHSGLLSVHGSLKEWPILKCELEVFRPEVTPSGRETFNARSGSHDDLLNAVALCSWWCQHDDMNAWGYYEYVRRRAAPNDTSAEEFVCGVDIGQSNDPTAICVMSRIDGPDPRTDRLFEAVEPPAQPESEVDGSGYVGSEGWFRDTDQQTKLALHDTISRGGPLAIKPPRPRRYIDPPQAGSLEWQEIEDEEFRFRSLLNGRDAEPGELAAHETNLSIIREAHR